MRAQLECGEDIMQSEPVAGPPLHLHWWSGRVDEDLVWLKLESKNHQLATLAINIVISLFITGTFRAVEPPEYQSSSSLQLCILRIRFVKCYVWALLIVHLDELCFYHWLFVLIISLSIN